MQAEFGVNREKADQLQLKEWRGSPGQFHFHSHIEIFFVDEGEGKVWINDRYQVLKAGELAVALSYDAHRFQSDKNAKVGCLIIPTRMCGEFLNETEKKRVKNPFIRNRETYETFRKCFDKIKQEQENKIKTLGYIYVILGTLLEQTELEERQQPLDPKLSSRILFYINEHFKDDLSLPCIASALGYTPSYLSQYFRSCFNIGINQYITVIRLREAVLLMKKKENDIAYCAFESGFNSVRTFYRAFEKEFGCTPKKYLCQTPNP